MSNAKTLYDKHIDAHTVCALDDQGHVLLYIDRQVINGVAPVRLLDVPGHER